MRNYLETIEELAKSKDLHEGAIKNFTKEILLKSSHVLNCRRSNIWLFEEKQTKLVCLLAYDVYKQGFTDGFTLRKEALPNYFKFLSKNKIIISNDAGIEPMNSELLESYIFPNKITSMIDVPLRSEGKMIGVICFEHVENVHDWTVQEEHFTQSVAQLLSLALETNKKREYRDQLEKIILQKEVLLSEINHRVKNNMAVIISLMNLQKHKTKDSYHEYLFEEIKNKVFSMSLIQQQLHTSGSLDSIDLANYLETLLSNLTDSYGLEKNINYKLDLEKNIELDISRAIPCGLISNEVLTNSFKYAFNDKSQTPELAIKLSISGGLIQLVFSDNGAGYDSINKQSGMGLELIHDLAEQIDATIDIKTKNGVTITLVFPNACSII